MWHNFLTSEPGTLLPSHGYYRSSKKNKVNLKGQQNELCLNKTCDL